MTKPIEVTQEDREALVEEVARAIHSVEGGLNYDYMDFCRDAATAAVRVMEAKLADRERAERAAVVAWLRRGSSHRLIDNQMMSNDDCPSDIANMLASALEAGQHRKDEE